MKLRHVRILLVSQMYPGDSEPDYGVFVRGLEQALTARGHTIERAVLTSRQGGKAKYARLASRSIFAARRTRPDVVYAHFLVPTGLLAGLASRAPLVVTAHGQDVANIGSIPGVRAATTAVVKRGARGLLVLGEERVELPAREGEVVDATGAGDALAAGFVVGGPELALEAAARCVAQPGAMP